MNYDNDKIKELILSESGFINNIRSSISNIIVGQNDLIEKLIKNYPNTFNISSFISSI